MKRIILPAIVILLSVACQNKAENQKILNNTTQTEMENQTEKKAIEKLLFSYRDALNASNVDMVLPLYTQGGVFMPANAPSAVGQEQVKAAYEFVFSNIQLHIEFFIDDITIEGNYAYARTSSKGTTLIHATGETVPEENRELFVLQKVNGDWKIDQYMFNKTK